MLLPPLLDGLVTQFCGLCFPATIRSKLRCVCCKACVHFSVWTEMPMPFGVMLSLWSLAICYMPLRPSVPPAHASWLLRVLRLALCCGARVPLHVACAIWCGVCECNVASLAEGMDGHCWSRDEHNGPWCRLDSMVHRRPNANTAYSYSYSYRHDGNCGLAAFYTTQRRPHYRRRESGCAPHT
jgi:hypothetical protein